MIETAIKVDCDHCGQPCDSEVISQEGLNFCCAGCQTVHHILEQSGGDGHITIPRIDRLAFLEDEDITDTLLTFSSPQLSKVSFRLPEIHCSSCIQILEELSDLHPGIQSSRIDFPNKRVSITFLPEIIDLRTVAELLTYVGYAPEINLHSANHEDNEKSTDKDLILKLGTAGFIFGNVMLLSFPEYLGLNDPLFERFFGYLSLALCIPLLTFSASDFLKSAYTSILNGGLNIDVPISIGVLALFGRSAYDIMSHAGSGYLDSLSGFVFFLLIGRWFQKKTYDKISFERNYESYFPLYVSRVVEGGLQPVMLRKIQVGDTLFIRSGEIIPCDSILLSETAKVDYSFVTGEERSTRIRNDEKLFAGGKNLSTAFRIKVEKAVDQSYLTRLWEEKASGEDRKSGSFMTDQIGKYFTISILLIAVSTLAFWLIYNPDMAMNAFTSVLIIACPCVIALSIPFTYGALLSLLASKGIFIKSTSIVENLQNADVVVLDKTGTITSGSKPDIEYIGKDLTFEEKQAIAALSNQSAHPLSRLIHQNLGFSSEGLQVDAYQEITGQGLIGKVNGMDLKLGSSTFVGAPEGDIEGTYSTVHILLNDHYKGLFRVKTQYRAALKSTLDYLRQHYQVSLLTGDEDFQINELAERFGFQAENMRFQQSPTDKKAFIDELQQEGKSVIMIGDGLNDAGALRVADAGIVVTEDLNNFTPASDVVLRGDLFDKIPEFLLILKKVKGILVFMYAMAIVYNIIGLFFAAQGLLSPIVAAILMPSSSISMVVTGYLLTRWTINRSTRDWHLQDHPVVGDQKLSLA